MEDFFEQAYTSHTLLNFSVGVLGIRLALDFDPHLETAKKTVLSDIKGFFSVTPYVLKDTCNTMPKFRSHYSSKLKNVITNINTSAVISPHKFPSNGKASVASQQPS